MDKTDGEKILGAIVRERDNATRQSKIEAWSTYIKYLEQGEASCSEPEFNLVYVFGSSLIPNLVFQNPYIMAMPRVQDEASIHQSMLWEGIDNFLVEPMGLRDEVEKACYYAFCTNMGMFEIGWQKDGTPINKHEEGTPFPRVSKVDNRKRKNFPWIRAVDPRKIIFPRGYRSMRELPWYAKVVKLPRFEVETIPELQKMVKKDAIVYESANAESQTTGLEGEMEKPELVEYLTFYIHRSVETGKVTWVDTKGTILFQADDPLQVDGLPLVVFNFNHALGDIYGAPDVSYIESQYKEGNELRADGRWQRKNATLKIIYDTNMMSEKDISKFLNGEPLPAVGINVPPDKSLKDCVYEVQNNVQREYMEYSSFLIKDTEFLLGFGPNQMGTVTQGRRTAYEMQQVAQNNMLRLSKRRNSVANAIGEIFTKINLLVSDNWKQTQVVPVLGGDAAVYYAAFTQEDMKGLAMIKTKVSADSLAPSSVEQRRADMLEVMQVLGQFSPDSAVILQPLIQKFISMFDWGEVKSVLPNKGGQVPINEVPTGGDPSQNLQQMSMLTNGAQPQTQGNPNANQQPV
jgi:hypothetical protein